MQKSTKVMLCILAIVLLFSIIYYAVSQQQLEYVFAENEQISPVVAVTLDKDTTIRQRLTVEKDELSRLRVPVGRKGESAPIFVRLTQADAVIYEAEISIKVAEGELLDLLANAVPVRVDTPLILELRSPSATAENAPVLYYGSIVRLSRVDVEQQIDEQSRIIINGDRMDGMLSYRIEQRSGQWIGKIYWLIVAVVLLALTGCGVHMARREKQGRPSLGLNLINAFTRYRFLISQMISRDFKTKYKRSVLGVMWSFLNPLLTMSVQYVVFSTIFKSGIPNFPVYLLIGIVCYSFFTDAVGQSLMSIVGNTNLITKVYVPKYIYPITRVFSCGINLLFSLVPLFIVMLLSATPFRPAALMLPFPLICLLLFCIGMGLLLCTCMTFFRDTQFLWQVVSMLWMYATPIFYPENILPGHLSLIIKLNPLYHVIRLMRSLLMDGISPDIRTYAICFLICFIPFVIGAWVFKRKQDRFILYI